MGKKLYSKEIDAKILDLYKKNTMIKDIIKETGAGKHYIGDLVKKNNIGRGSGRRNEIDSKLLELGTPESDYWIGYIIADGNISKGKNRNKAIAISTIDEEIVNKAIDHFGKYLHVYKHKLIPNRNQVYQLKFSCIKIHNYLIDIGITPKKSLTINLNFPLNSHILRGIFDGDGSVHNKSFTCKITTGSENLGNQIVNFLKENGIFSKLRLRKGTNHYDVNIERKADYVRFYNLLYTNAKYYMERKKSKFKIEECRQSINKNKYL